MKVCFAICLNCPHVLRLPPGVIAISTDRILPSDSSKTSPAVPEDSDLEELHDVEAAEPVKILQAVATFDEFAVWGHDQLPAADDAFIKGTEEWIAFAEAIHSGPGREGKSDDKTGS